METVVSTGSDLAVAIAVSADPGEEPLHHLRDHGVDADLLVILEPVDGPHAQAVSGPADAVAYTHALRNVLRDLIRDFDPERLHLFLVVPNMLALMLGHKWNRMRPTTLYEHLGVGRGYQRAFTIAS
jgi:hypothetical protein